MVTEQDSLQHIVGDGSTVDSNERFFTSVGILTSRGGKTSHAAVVARGMGKPCIVGCSDLKIDYNDRKCFTNGKTINEGDTITIDGSSGAVFLGEIPTIEPKMTDDFRTILNWAQKIKKIGGSISLILAPNPDILEYVARLPKSPFCVGFAAETENLEKNAEAKRSKKKIPLLAANLAQDAIGSDESALILFDDKGKHPLPKAPKIVQARRLIKHISLLYKK